MRISEDIVTIGQFKTHAARMLRQLHESRRPLVITQHGVPAAVVMSPEEYDRLAYESEFVQSVSEGLADVEAGRLVTHDEALRRLADARGNRGDP
jgi:prevent-host-death family protein